MDLAITVRVFVLIAVLAVDLAFYVVQSFQIGMALLLC